MRTRNTIALGIVLLFGTAAFGQDYQKAEIGLDYSYTRFNPENSNWTNGGFSLNGGGGDIAYFFTKNFGIKGEFQGAISQTRKVPISAPPCFLPSCPASFQASLFTYNAIVVYKARMEKFEPYAEVGFGGAHSNAYLNGTPGNNAFDFVIGGGIDIPVSEHVAIRAGEFDFLLTRFGNRFTSGNQNQSNFRYQAGVIFRF